MILLGFWRGTVEMKKARLRALTQLECFDKTRNCMRRNEESTTEGIDTSYLNYQLLSMCFCRNEESTTEGIDTL